MPVVADTPRAITIASVLFDGILQVEDAVRLGEALRTGIGRAKSYGQGLLSVASAGEQEFSHERPAHSAESKR